MLDYYIVDMSAGEKYSKAIELYRDTDLSQAEICRRLGLSVKAFSRYLCREHRDLLVARHGVQTDDPSCKLHGGKGQSMASYKKYHDAITACGSMDYLRYNVSEIAHMFGLSGSALSNQLRVHFPDVLEWRESERKKRGWADNKHRGASKSTKKLYAPAVEMLRVKDVTIKEAAELCGVSFTGLRQYIQFYCKDLMNQRSEKRKKGQNEPRIGTVAGNGKIRRPSESSAERFAEAVTLYKYTDLTEKEIAERTGVSQSAFHNHIRTWHRHLILARHGIEVKDDTVRYDLSKIKRYRAKSREKYAAAIAMLKEGGCNTEAVAKQFGFEPVVFRAYLREHEPELWMSLGMTKLDNGRRVLRRSLEKYNEVVEVYSHSSESLNSICQRLGVNYNGAYSFIVRNHPEAKAAHEKLKNEAKRN